MVGLIIFGRRTMSKIVQRGAFNCPRCGPGRQFAHKQVKRWFTLYFIPVIPMGTVGSYVECQQCAATFGPEALSLALPEARVVK
jgi:zinc ribbon protein